jgi:hypothetical protein
MVRSSDEVRKPSMFNALIKAMRLMRDARRAHHIGSITVLLRNQGQYRLLNSECKRLGHLIEAASLDGSFVRVVAETNSPLLRMGPHQ